MTSTKTLENTGKYYAEKEVEGVENREDSTEKRLQRAILNDEIDSRFEFFRPKGYCDKNGWLINFHPSDILDKEKRLVSSVDYYFLEEDGNRFKISFPFKPYFYILARKGTERDVSTYISKRFADKIFSVETIAKEDLSLPNHLVGLQRSYLKLTFFSVEGMLKVKRDILPSIKRNKEKNEALDIIENLYVDVNNKKTCDHLDNILDIREYDVPYHIRVSIDMKLMVGKWYRVISNCPNDIPNISLLPDMVDLPDPIVLAFDIETTKLPLKFPDAQSDQIFMISYMIDGQGFLLCNRDIVSADVEDFEYSPRPEFEGPFTVFNEPNEVSLLKKFLDHILEVKPNIIVTYNGDFFDWPFIESRCAIHEIDLYQEIGFQKEGSDYLSRSCIHMDCFKWVKRDSYLPVGSQNLKAVAKAKLYYNPVEIDPEDMCKMASEQPQVMANYSVSDAVATYYLYMKYVHPFIFALCTIIPLQPDEVLRKGSGTLCESLLMVEAFHANIIFPNKYELTLNRLTNDGHVIDSETYVGGHVEALESGVFRSDLPCRFRLVPDAFQNLIKLVDETLKQTLMEEEKIDLNDIENMDQVCDDIIKKLSMLRDNPNRLENPIIYHLDVAAMYPNIILTNRLQPSAIIDDAMCAACAFNRPDARCRKQMTWSWRAEYMPASRNEYQRIQQQLENEKFPSQLKNGQMMAFHQLPKEQQAEIEKKRLTEYCKKAYKKIHITREEEKITTVCQRENSFYVDTVRAFRDRRYEFKALTKIWKGKVVEAEKTGDAAEIKRSNGLLILYDSLQLAHKCILNSFYGYVMRRGARWYSMEMAGVVCHTGANIITKAREIIEQIGRPLELDTDGIWCVLPATFPENYTFITNNPKKPRVQISYPGAMLNMMVKEFFTNEQYHDLVDRANLGYSVRKENSIFFEVDGPYRAMVLPASKEEGKKLKKRYAVFNFDGTLAELKGFEVKRRGELQLVKNFQSSVFDAFLEGKTLEQCYQEVAKIADYWLDVLYSKAENMPDNELFDLISENRSMSRKLEDYGSQKSTSISTAKRLAEFLGDQMVKDAGLACKFIISKKPEGASVTDRAIPLAIFQSEMSIRKYYLKKWLKNPAMVDFDIRRILDWEYYAERLGSAIQKIITIPAALQGISNPVPRIVHPDWLHKKLLEKNDVFKQKRINEMFSSAPKNSTRRNIECRDIEDIGSPSNINMNISIDNLSKENFASGTFKRKRNDSNDLSKHWKEFLGNPPTIGNSKDEINEWIAFHKKKWLFQIKQRRERIKKRKFNPDSSFLEPRNAGLKASNIGGGIGGFLKRTAKSIADQVWQIVEIAQSNDPGVFQMWTLIGSDLHCFKLIVPRKFYVNQRTPKQGEGIMWRKVNKLLPRSHRAFNLYEYSVTEDIYIQHLNEISMDLQSPDIEGVYETQVPLLFRAIMQIGCVCSLSRECAKIVRNKETDTFELNHLIFRGETNHPYLDDTNMRYIYLYHHVSGFKHVFAMFIPSSKKCQVFILDTVRTDQLPNLNSVFLQERNSRLGKECNDDILPEIGYSFDIQSEKDLRQVQKGVQKILTSYRDEKKGPTFLSIETNHDLKWLTNGIPGLLEMPIVKIHSKPDEVSFGVLDWTRVASKTLMSSFFNFYLTLPTMLEQSKYLRIPIGNLPSELQIYAADILYARYLSKHNHLLWASPSDRPDLGGKEADDGRLTAEYEDAHQTQLNRSGFYTTTCIELELISFSINTLVQSNRVHDFDGISGTSFDLAPVAAIDELVQGHTVSNILTSYDEIALCSNAFRILKSLVQNWIKDVAIDKNVYADQQLVQFYRWLKSPSSLLYDPALGKTLNNLMTKLFSQLMAEFSRLGSVIVYADLSRIILCTKKHGIFEALAYVEYITNNIRSKELYSIIDLTYTRSWRILFWMDPANHGGIMCYLPTDEVNETQIKYVNTFQQDEVATMNWNLSNFLPKFLCLEAFNTTINDYICLVLNFLNNNQNISDTPIQRKDGTISQITRDENEPSDSLLEFCRKLIRDDMAHKLFTIAQNIQKKTQQQNSDVLNFPDLPGSYLIFSNPALELIKSICQVLFLDRNITDVVHHLKRDLLKLIGIGEFSDQSDWLDPCLSYNIREVICKNCNNFRDVDLCRDNITSSRGMWSCAKCEHEYEVDAIEMRMLEIVNRKLLAYVLQDVNCFKCKQVSDVNLPTNCRCAGNFQNVISSQNFLKNIHLFHRISKFYNMKILNETITMIINIKN